MRDLFERWQMRRSLKAISDRLSRLEVQVAVTNRAVAQIEAQSRMQPVTTQDQQALDAQEAIDREFGPVHLDGTPVRSTSWDPASGDLTGYQVSSHGVIITSPDVLVIDPEKAAALIASHRETWAKARKISRY